MKPKIMLSTTIDETYIDCAPLTTKAWSALGYEPVVAFVGKEMPINFRQSLSDNCKLIHISSIEGLSDGYVSQTIRVLMPVLYPNDICITGDIDMVPLSKTYFDNLVENAIRSNKFIIASSDAYQNIRYPICYLAGFGRYFSSILKLDKDNFKFESIVQKILKDWNNFGLGWDTDELIFSGLLVEAEKAHKIEVDRQQRGWINNHFGRIAADRIDRVCWTIDYDKLFNHDYIDAHLPRPYRKNMHLIRPILKYYKL